MPQGYALITGKPSIVSLHTYPGLANGMFNMRNALMAGVPMLVINGQQDSRFLIHNPVLGAPNTRLAETATKYAYEVTSVDDLAVALQRCYLQARLQPTGPVFLSIPMNFMLDRTAHTTFKTTRIIEDVVPRSVGDVVRALAAVPSGKLAIVADYAVGAGHGLDALSRIATALGADIYAAPFHVQGTVDPLHPNFRGQLPPTTREINQILSRYQTMLLVGEKVDTFTYDGSPALPGDLQVIQIAPATSQLGFDYPVRHGGARRRRARRSRRLPAHSRPTRSRHGAGPDGGRGGAGSEISGFRQASERRADPRRAARISTATATSSPKARPRTRSCRTWRSGSASATCISRRAAEGLAGPCRSASASVLRPASTPSASSATAAACSRSMRSGPRPSTAFRRYSSAS